MKKISIIYRLVVILALAASSSLAASFKLDFYGGDTSYPAGKTFETTITLSQGQKVMVDVWVTGLSTPPLIGSIDMEFQWDTGSIHVNSVTNSHLTPDRGTPPAIWDAAAGVVIPTGYKLSVIKFSGGKPGPDIQMQTLELEGTAAGSAYAKGTMGSNAIIDENGDPVTNPQDGNVPVEVLPPSSKTTTTSSMNTTSSSSTSSTSTTTIELTTTTTLIPISTSIIASTSTTTAVITICVIEEIYDKDSKEVQMLKFYRDTILSTTPEGQELIRLYYEWSPAIVKAMEEDKVVKEKMKEVVDGMVELTRGEVEQIYTY